MTKDRKYLGHARIRIEGATNGGTALSGARVKVKVMAKDGSEMILPVLKLELVATARSLVKATLEVVVAEIDLEGLQAALVEAEPYTKDQS